jgi:hypothetical protein
LKLNLGQDAYFASSEVGYLFAPGPDLGLHCSPCIEHRQRSDGSAMFTQLLRNAIW